MIGGVLNRGRRMAEGRMLDACRVDRVVGKVFDDATGKYIDDVIVVFKGRCRIASRDVAGTETDSAGRLLAISSPEVHLPIAAVGVRPGDQVVITASQTRPEVVGRVLRISTAFDGTQTTALRYRAEVADGTGL